MSLLLAIDPGSRALGWAVFDLGSAAPALLALGGQTLPADMRTSNITSAVAWHASQAELSAWLVPGRVNQVVCERMVAAGREGRPDDLLNVALVGATLSGRTCAPVDYVKPNEWKGTMPKDVNHARTKLALGDPLDALLRRVTAPRRPDALDAAGIGLWWAGLSRWARRR